MTEKKHTIYCMPYRVLRRMVIVTDWSWRTGVEYGAMVYGDRENKLSINMGVIRRGTPKGADVKIAGRRRSILMFHNHPPGHTTLPSTGDIGWTLWFHDTQDRWGTFEAFAIGAPESEDEGRVTFYMVVDWERMREVYRHIEPADEEYSKYLRGLRPDIPEEVYEAHDYLWRRLHLFTRRKHLRYHPPIELPEIEIFDEEYEEPYTRDDIIKTVRLMEKFPEMEFFLYSISHSA